MKTLDDQLVSQIGVQATAENDDDLTAKNVRNLLQNHMENTTRLRDMHRQAMKNHETLLRAKLRTKNQVWVALSIMEMDQERNDLFQMTPEEGSLEELNQIGVEMMEEDYHEVRAASCLRNIACNQDVL
jgi:hypothetical protein